MATAVVRFTNAFSDESEYSLDVGPVDVSAINITNIRNSVKAWNQQLASDTSKAQLMQGNYGGDWTRISAVRITVTDRIYIS